MRAIRNEIGGVGNLLFKEAFIWSLLRKGLIPDVYVQNYHLWEEYKDEIKMRFSSGIGSIDKVALHIRRGDYLKAAQFHTNLWETDYYRKAVRLFPNAHFLVFCRDNQNPLQDQDDQNWCKENLPSLVGENFEMYQHGTETDDLNAMASCKGLIAANSTFSWWAAFLGNHEKVLFPHEKSWFTDGAVRCALLPEWPTIQV